MQEFSIMRKKRAWVMPKISILTTLFAVFFGLLPVLTIPFISLNHIYAKSIILVFVSLATVLIFSLAVIRRKIEHINISTSVVMLWIIFGVALLYAHNADAPLDAYLSPSFGIEGVLMLGVLALLATVPLLTLQKIEQVRLFFQVLGGSTVLLGFTGVLARMEIIPINTISVLIDDFVPAAAALLVGVCFFMRTIELRTRESVLFATVCAGALACLLLGDTPRIMWGIVTLFVGGFFVSEGVMIIRTARFRGVTSSLLNKRTRAHRTFFLLGLVFVITIIPFASPEKISPYTLTNTSISRTSLPFDVSREILSTSLKSSAYFGVGFGNLQSTMYTYQNAYECSECSIEISHRGGLLSSFILTYILQFGIVGALLFFVFLVSFFNRGVHALYFTMRYEREVYVYMQSVLITGTLLWIFSLYAQSAQSSLYLAALMTGIMVVLSHKLHPSHFLQADVAHNGRRRFLIPFVCMILAFMSLTGMYAIWIHGNATLLVATAESTERDISLAERLRLIDKAYAYMPHRDLLRMRADLETSIYRTYLESITEYDSIDTEIVLKRTKHVAEVVSMAVETMPYDVPVQQTARDFFTLLASMGVEGASSRAADIYGTLALLAPEQKIKYRLQQVHYLIESKQYEKALEVLDTHMVQTASSTALIKSYINAELQDYVAAAEQLRAYIAVEGANLETYLALGVYVGYVDGVQAALPILEQALSMSYDRPDAYIYLSIAYIALNSPDGARTILEHGILQATDVAPLTKLLDEINRTGTITSATIWNVAPSEPVIETIVE